MHYSKFWSYLLTEYLSCLWDCLIFGSLFESATVFWKAFHLFSLSFAVWLNVFIFSQSWVDLVYDRKIRLVNFLCADFIDNQLYYRYFNRDDCFFYQSKNSQLFIIFKMSNYSFLILLINFTSNFDLFSFYLFEYLIDYIHLFNYVFILLYNLLRFLCFSFSEVNFKLFHFCYPLHFHF